MTEVRYFVARNSQPGVLGPYTLDHLKVMIQRQELHPLDQIIPAHPEHPHPQSVIEVIGQSTRKFPRSYVQLKVLINDGHRIIPSHAIQLGQRGSLVLIDFPLYEQGDHITVHLRSDTLHRPVLTPAKVVGSDRKTHLSLQFTDINSEDEQYLANVVGG